MPVDVSFLDNETGILYEGKGVVTVKELAEAKFKVFSHIDKIDNYRFGLIDYSEVTHYRVSTSNIEQMVEQNKKLSLLVGDAAIALIARDDATYGLIRMWEAYMESIGWETNTFRNRPEGEAWLKQIVKSKFGIDITLK